MRSGEIGRLPLKRAIRAGVPCNISVAAHVRALMEG